MIKEDPPIAFSSGSPGTINKGEADWDGSSSTTGGAKVTPITANLKRSSMCQFKCDAPNVKTFHVFPSVQNPVADAIRRAVEFPESPLVAGHEAPFVIKVGGKHSK